MGTGAAGRDPDAASRTAPNTGGATGSGVGSVQGSAVPNITATFSSASDVSITRPGDTASGALSITGGGRTYIRGYQGGSVAGDLSFNAANVSSVYQNTSEARSQNANVEYIIKV